MKQKQATIEHTDKVRRDATAELDQERRSELGQFLTPSDTARLMASMFKRLPASINLLEAGAGTGSLIAAFTKWFCRQNSKPQNLNITAYEIESVLIPHLKNTIDQCHAECQKSGISFGAIIEKHDFIDSASSILENNLYANSLPRFNAAILNPPYKKIASNSRERRRLQQVGLDATNLYAAFVALAIRLLDNNGQLVAIIPRSFCNGPYFRSFRNVLLDETTIQRIHIFDSRTSAFKDDSVLQENVIIHLAKKHKRSATISISSSSNASSKIISRKIPYDDIVRSSYGDRFIHIPTSDNDDAVALWMAGLPSTLKDLKITVSTGRVVDFRARDWLMADATKETVPLIYPCHFDNGVVNWPKDKSKKPNAIIHSAHTHSLLVPSGHYVITKRFSSKEEKRRIVASTYDPEHVVADWVGFENHLNYYHDNGQSLERDLAYGLATYLNSSNVDIYFRQFNGHTQVNATDLRTLRYPTRAQLKKLGHKMFNAKNRTQERIDTILKDLIPSVD